MFASGRFEFRASLIYSDLFGSKKIALNVVTQCVFEYEALIEYEIIAAKAIFRLKAEVLKLLRLNPL